MKEYLLLFRGDPSSMDPQNDPVRWQAHMMKWKAWMERLGRDGKLVGGQPLAKAGSVITGQKKTLTDGPFAEGKEVVGGYLMIRSADLQEAVQLSQDCPVLENDGTVEVRQIEQLNF